MSVVRRMMDYAIRSLDPEIKQGRQIKDHTSRVEIERVVHDGINQYCRAILHRLVRGQKYKLRSLEKKTLSGLILRGPEEGDKRLELQEEDRKEVQQRIRDEFRTIVAKYDNDDEVIQKWKNLRKI